MKRIPKFAALSLSALLVLSLTGCVTRVLDFTVVSNKNVDIKVPESSLGQRVIGVDHVWWIFSIPLGSPSLEEAVDRAIESAGPGYDALIDGVIYSEFYWYFFTGKSGYKVEGTPIKTREIITHLEKQGRDVGEFLAGALYHSSLGMDNKEAIEKIGVKIVIPKD